MNDRVGERTDFIDSDGYRTAEAIEIDVLHRSSLGGVVRALQVLRLVNEQQGLSLHDIHVVSGLPKPTVFRILQTLKREGYVEPDGVRGVFHVARKALELSSGYTERTLIVKVTAPIALATTRKVIKWPLAIGTLDRGAIVVRYSSMPYSRHQKP